MLSTISALLIALLALAAGILIGAFGWRHFGNNRNHSRELELEQKLQDSEQRLSHYQEEVTEHFVETSRRVNELTRNYRDVHEYLASSAMKLTSPSLGRELRAAAQISWSEDSGPDAAPEQANDVTERAPVTAAGHYRTGDRAESSESEESTAAAADTSEDTAAASPESPGTDSQEESSAAEQNDGTQRT